MSSLARASMWSSSAQYIAHSALIGYGDGQSLYLGGYYDPVSAGFTIDDSYLSMLLNFGVVGLGAFAFFIAVLAQGLVRVALRSQRDAGELAIALLSMVLAIILVMKAISLTDNVAFLYVAAGALAGLRARQFAGAAAPQYRRQMPQRSSR